MAAALCAICALVLAAPASLARAAGAAVAAADAGSATISVVGVEVELARLVNRERAERGLPVLRIDVRLVASARGWSGEQAARGRLAHDPGLPGGLPSGVSAWAENVGAVGAHDDAATALHRLFMGSAGHRDAILSRRFTDLGVGVASAGDTVYVTQRFTAGAPAQVAAAVEATAALAAQHFGGGAAAHAVVARDDVYADALASGPLAGRAGPILLTPPGPALHPSVRFALERTLPRGGTVWIAGGTAAVTSAVQRELEDAGWSVRRLAGTTRVETAARVAAAVAARDGRPGTVIVATAAGWPDAAAGGAYGARTGTPVLLAQRDTVPAATREALRALGPRRVVALGGTAVLSDGVVRALGARRVAGPTRQDTSAAIARDLWGHDDAGPARWMAVPGYGGDAWTWALGVAPAAARRSAPVLLLGPELAAGVRDYLAGLYAGNASADLLVHGPAPAATVDEVRALLR